jgi:hypothetical protein
MSFSRILLSAFTACAIAACTTLPTGTDQATIACPPAGYDKAQLEELRTNKFTLPETTDPDQFALALASCLADPDPFYRDKIGYEGLAALLRGGNVSPETVKSLRKQLTTVLEGEADPHGVAKPFSVLGLSEVARVDRLSPVFSDAQRAELVSAAASYMTSIDDYRGFDEVEGWRHGVAHTSDLMLQLTLNEKVSKEQLMQLRDALATQVSPENTHFYIYGESERLARPVLFMARRGVFTEAEWTAWFASLAEPAPLTSWDDAFSSQAGLARRHNLNAFAQVLYLNADFSQDENIKMLMPGIVEMLKAVP